MIDWRGGSIAVCLLLCACGSTPPPDEPDAGGDAAAQAGIDAAGQERADAAANDLADAAANDLADAAGPDLTDAATHDLADAAGQDLTDAAGQDAADAAGQDMEQPVTYVEDFDDVLDVDATGSTVPIDTATGAARLLARYELDGDVGNGSGGDYAPKADEVLPSGVHQLRSFTLDGVTVTSPADLTLRVDGPLVLENGARLDVAGALRIVVSGDLTVHCSLIDATGTIAIHHTTDRAIDLDCPLPSPFAIKEAMVTAYSVFPGQPAGRSHVDVRTRGPVAMRSQGYFSAEDGAASVRAYGDIAMDQDAYLLSSAGHAIRIETEGRFTMDHDSYVVGDGPEPGGGDGVQLRSVGGVQLDHDSYLIADHGGRVDVITEGEIRLTRGSYFIADHGHNPSMGAVGRGIALDTDSWFIVGGSSTGQPAGPLRVDSDGPVTLAEGSSLLGGPGTCAAGGDVEVRATGAIALSAASSVEAGDSKGATPCLPGAGGNVLLSSNQTITLTDASHLAPGTGQPAGMATRTEHASHVLHADAGLVSRGVVVSRALPVTTSPSYVRRVKVISDGASAFIAPDGTTFIPAAQAVGRELADGWRWKVELGARMFDGSSVDRLEVEYGPRAN